MAYTIISEKPRLLGLLLVVVVVSLVVSVSALAMLVEVRQEVSSLRGSHAASFDSGESVFSGVEERTIPVIAVAGDGKGMVEYLTVKVYPGEGDVLIVTNPYIEPDTQYSANRAVWVAQNFTGLGRESDFVFDFGNENDVQLVGGGSAGASMAVAVIAALEDRPLNSSVAMTGAINPDGSVGGVGGVLEKAEAAAEAGYTTFLVPIGQSTVSYYDRQIARQPLIGGMSVLRTKYVHHSVNVSEVAQEKWGLEVVEVGSVEEASRYFLN